MTINFGPKDRGFAHDFSKKSQGKNANGLPDWKMAYIPTSLFRLNKNSKSARK